MDYMIPAVTVVTVETGVAVAVAVETVEEIVGVEIEADPEDGSWIGSGDLAEGLDGVRKAARMGAVRGHVRTSSVLLDEEGATVASTATATAVFSTEQSVCVLGSIGVDASVGTEVS